VEIIILLIIGIMALTIIGLKIRRNIQDLRQDKIEGCNYCSNCSAFCSGKVSPAIKVKDDEDD
jgi:succinate dehydrogenase/fumarate reductase-like Fe-S protein